MPIASEAFELPGAAGEAVRGEVRVPEGAKGPFPVVLVLHGFKGFRKWGFFPWLGESLAGCGFAAVTFDFSHNGTGADGEAYPRKDLFRRMTWRRNQDDLEAVLGAVLGGNLPLASTMDRKRVALVGHSLGGGIAILHAARNPGWFRCVAGLAPVATPDRFHGDQKRAWRERGELPIVNSRTGEVLPLGLDFLRDIEARRAELDVPAEATGLTCPLLVVHGAEDTSVPPSEGRSIVERVIAAGLPARFALVPRTQHTFDAVHPFAGPTPALEHAFTELSRFLETYLVRFDPSDARGGAAGRA